MTDNIVVRSADGTNIPAYVARPSVKPLGAIVLLQEVFGVNSHIRSVADRFSDAGFLVAAPAVFQRLAPGTELGYTQEDIQRGIALKDEAEALPAPGVLQDIQAAIDWAGTQAHKVGIVGFCWGGLLAWRSAALLEGLSAAVTYYGGGMTTGSELSRAPRVPLLSHFGLKDSMIPIDTLDAFAKAQPAVEMHRYDADHGFNCDQRGSYDPVAQQLAFDRTIAFFSRHLS